MEIVYLGGSTLRVKGEQIVSFDPGEPVASGEIALYSSRRKGSNDIINGPGEYEIRDVLILTLALDATALLHAIDMGGTSLVHLQAPPDRLSSAILDSVGRVDLLLVDANRLEAAAAAVRDLEPRVVLPYGTRAEELCKELGVAAEPKDRFAWTGAAATPKAVLLKPRASKRKAA